MFKVILKLISVRNAFVFAIGLVVLLSCNDDIEDLSVGKEFTQNTTDIIQVDTFSVELSTVKMDSVVTSATGYILVGCYDDGNFGRITAQTYFQVGLASFVGLKQDDRFDSLTIVMPYSNYYYGDTNAIQELEVYSLSEDLSDEDVSSYYNTSEVDYFNSILGQKRYYPRPTRDSAIEIRISDLLGKDILEKMKSEAEEVSSDEEFQKFIKGFVVIPNKSESSSVIGFNTEDLMLKMYTSRIEEELEEIEYNFRVAATQYQFNQIQSNRAGTLLGNLVTQDEDIASSYIENKAFVQAGTGIVTKVKFPFLESILFDEKDIILSVELIIKPEIESYDGNFPESLAMYETNQKNRVVQGLTDKNGASVISTFVLDEYYHLDTYYKFNITDFINEQIKDGYIDKDRSLLITVPSPDYSTTLERLIISDSKTEDKAPVEITYMRPQ